MEQPQTIGKRQHKARLVVAEIAQSITNGKTLKEIGQKYFPNAENPSQTISNCLAQPNYQREMKLLSNDFDKKKIRSVISDCLDNKNASIRLKAAELGAKIEKMVTEHAAPDAIRITIEREYKRLEDATLSELQAAINDKMGLLPEAQAEVIAENGTE